MFFGAATFGLTALNFFAETLPVEFVGTKADLLAEMALSLVWKVHVVSVTLLKVRIVRLAFQKRFHNRPLQSLLRWLNHQLGVFLGLLRSDGGDQPGQWALQKR